MWDRRSRGITPAGLDSILAERRQKRRFQLDENLKFWYFTQLNYLRPENKENIPSLPRMARKSFEICQRFYPRDRKEQSGRIWKVSGEKNTILFFACPLWSLGSVAVVQLLTTLVIILNFNIYILHIFPKANYRKSWDTYCGDWRRKEQIKPRRVLECRNGKTRPLTFFLPPCCNY